MLLTQTALPLTASTSFSLAMQTQKKVAGSASALLGFFSTISGGFRSTYCRHWWCTTALPTALVIAVAEVLALIIFLTITRKYVKTIASNTKG